MYIPFLLCREKRYVEENTVQQAVMIPAKEVKLIIYQVGQENSIDRKVGARYEDNDTDLG
jgi:hypothetical protein